MKQGNDFSGERILSFGQVELVLTTRSTSQTNIFKGSVPAFGVVMNVVKDHRSAAVCFSGQTVGATPTIYLLNLRF